MRFEFQPAVEVLHDKSMLPLTLGPRILRAETAAIAALSILQSRLDEIALVVREA